MSNYQYKICSRLLLNLRGQKPKGMGLQDTLRSSFKYNYFLKLFLKHNIFSPSYSFAPKICTYYDIF